MWGKRYLMPRGVYIRKRPPVPPRNKPRPWQERFWPKVDQTGECWLWTAAVDGRGYGKLQVGTFHEPRYANAARLSYELAYGPIPAGRNVLHQCDVRRCVRPDHLFRGTTTDNQRDMARKSRSTAKLSHEQVAELRRLHQAGLLNMSGAARHYGVSVTSIWRAVHRYTHTHLP
jgi:hypothetical protein